MSRLEAFADRESLAEAVAATLAQAVAGPGPHTLVVTGGGTAGPAYDRLCRADADWSHTTITLTDERRVSPDSPLSNQRLIREHLLQGPAAAARFLPLGDKSASLDEAVSRIDAELAALTPFSAVLLGMGEDGHIASLFPASPGLEAAMDVHGPCLATAIAVSGLAPFAPRLSLTLRALTSTRLLVVMITGSAKRALIERVESGLDDHLPVAALLRQTLAPVRIFWSP